MRYRSPLLAFAVASLLATAAVAQDAPPPPPPPPPPAEAPMPLPPPPAPNMPADQGSMSMPAPAASMTDEHSAQIQANGQKVTVDSGMPPPDNAGPKPPFSQLDANHDGRISQEEAQAYLPLYNDWIHVAHHAKSITRKQYEAWH